MKTFCPYCGTLYLALPPEGHVCACGVAWRDLAPFPRPDLDAAEWETLTQLLLVRSGGMCEVRSPECLAPRGDLFKVRDSRLVSRHHRLARHMGGTSNPAIHSLANLLIVCGHGTRGCHGWIEHHAMTRPGQPDAYTLGLLIRQPAARGWTAGTDPARVPLLMASGRRVWLHPTSPEYLTALPQPLSTCTLDVAG